MSINAQVSPAVIAYLVADQPTKASYNPPPLFSYNPFGEILVERFDVGRYYVSFPGLEVMTDVQLGGEGFDKAQVFGDEPGHCSALTTEDSETGFAVRCFDEFGNSVDRRFAAFKLFPAANPVDLSFVSAYLSSAQNYNAHWRRSYNSYGTEPFSMSRTGAGEYQADYNGFTPQNLQLAPTDVSNRNCRIRHSSQSIILQRHIVNCWNRLFPAESKYSVLSMVPSSKVGALAFTQVEHDPDSSYVVNSKTFNPSGLKTDLTRFGPGHYEVKFNGFEANRDTNPGGYGHAMISATGEENHVQCNPEKWISNTVTVRCYSGVEDTLEPYDIPFYIAFVYRQMVTSESGIINFDSFSDGQVITAIPGEPVTFSPGLTIEECEGYSDTCVHAWSGNKVAWGKQSGTFGDIDMIGIDFETPQTSFSAHVNQAPQDGGSRRSISLNVYDPNGTLFSTTNYNLHRKPKWSTRIEYRQQSGSPAISRIEIIGGGSFEGILIDDISYGDTELPVELSSFTIVADGQDVHVSWETLREITLAGFRVEQMTKEEWISASGLIAATSPNGGSYSQRFENVSSGAQRFRLVSVDRDGSVAYSDVIETVVAPSTGITVTDVFPNPMRRSGVVTIVSNNADVVSPRIYNMLGQLVLEISDVELAANIQTSISIDTGSLASGMYFLRILGKRVSESQTLLISK